MNALIDKDSQIPYHVQLKSILDSRIRNLEFPDGKLPSENELAQQYAITVTTIRKVLAELRNEERIYTIKGLGTFVKKPKLEIDIAEYLSLGKVLQQKSLSEHIELVRRAVVPFDSGLFGGSDIPNVRSKMLNIERIRVINGEPLVIERLFFNNDLCGPMIEQADDKMLYDYLINDLNINVTSIDEYLEPITLDRTDAELLETKVNSAALLITKIAYQDDNTWLEFSNTIIRGDRCRYHIRLK